MTAADIPRVSTQGLTLSVAHYCPSVRLQSAQTYKVGTQPPTPIQITYTRMDSMLPERFSPDT